MSPYWKASQRIREFEARPATGIGTGIMTMFSRKIIRLSAVLLATGTLSACEDFTMPNLGLRTPPPATTPAIARPAPDSRGVITYETYQVMVARSGDTLTSMATRVGISPEVLARHNGLPVGYSPRGGELLALPENVGGTVVGTPSGWSPEIASTAISNATTGRGSIGGSNPSVGTPNEPLRHRVEAGDTAYSIARLYNVSVTALASWNGLGPDLMVRIGQELIIPVADTQQIAATTRVASVATPTPAPAPAPAPVAPPAAVKAFIAPVSGKIIRGFNPAPGRNKSDGIDYAVAAGTAVKAAADGTVALVSKSNGSLGTIVLIRHANGLMTIYGRVDNVTVAKGDRVTRGQTIGVVAAGDTPSVHFEVRKGTESVDPAPYM